MRGTSCVRLVCVVCVSISNTLHAFDGLYNILRAVHPEYDAQHEFAHCLINIFANHLQNKKDTIVSDDGKKASSFYKYEFATKTSNVLSLFSYNYLMNNINSFSGFSVRQEYSMLILSGKQDHYLYDIIDFMAFKEIHVILAFYEGIQDEQLERNIDRCLTAGLINTVALVNDQRGVRVVRGAFVTLSNCTTVMSIQETSWREQDLETIYDIFKEKKNINRRGCELNVSSLIIPPNVVYDEGSPQAIGGMETQIIFALAADMNFTPNFIIKQNLQWGGVSDNGTSHGVIGDVYSGVSEIGMGVIWPTQARKDMFDMTHTFASDGFGWAIPNQASRFTVLESATGYLMKGFQPKGWICIVATVIILPLMYVARNQIFRPREQSLVAIISDALLVAISFLVQRPSYEGYFRPQLSIKITIIFWLFYSLIISTIYTGYLSGLVLVPDRHKDLDTLGELLRYNIPMGAAEDVLDAIENFSDDDSVYSLIKLEVQPMSPSYKYLAMIANNSRLAYCGNVGTLKYNRNKNMLMHGICNNTSYHIMKESFMNYPNIFILKKGSPLTERANIIINRLIQSGLVYYWKVGQEYIDVTKQCKQFQPEKLSKFIYIFYFYGFGMGLATLVFILELFIVKFNGGKHKKQKMFNRSPRYFDYCE